MTLGALRYSRVNALVRSMVSRLLTRADWQSLLTAVDVAEVVRLLSETTYGSQVRAAASPDLPVVERALRLALADTYDRLIHALLGAPRDLVETLLLRRELDNLKAILRAVAGQLPRETVFRLLFPLGRYSRLPVEDLLRAGGISEAAELLDGTAYGRVLHISLDRYAEEGSLFPVEVALDLDYFRRLWARVEALSGLDYTTARKFMGSRYDVLNLDWLIRFRLLYRLSPEEIFNYTLPHGYRITDRIIRRAAAASDLPGIAAELPEPYRGLLREVGTEPGAVERAEVRLHRQLSEVARSAFLGYPFQLGEVLAYLWLREAEVHDLEVILEGKRAGRSSEAMAALLWEPAVQAGT